NTLIYHFGFDRTEQRIVKAKTTIEKALEIQPYLPEAHIVYGWYHFVSGRQYDLAMKEFAIAEKYLPNDSRIFHVKGVIKKRQGNFEQAIEYLKKASELNPQEADNLSEIALSMQYLRNFSEAEKYYNQAISLAPDRVWVYEEFAELYYRWQGNLIKARKVMEQSPDKSGHNDYWYELEYREGNYQEALMRLDNITDESIENQRTVSPRSLLQARIYESMGESNQARTSLKLALDILEERVKEFPDDYRIHETLGETYARLRRNEEAIREGVMAVELMPVEKETLMGLNMVENLAFIYVLIGKQDKAIEKIEYLLSIHSYVTVPYFQNDPRWSSISNNPRFLSVMEKYEEEHGD
ncbi:MAG: tetratricopeptide repeat protein, partial [Candidatus Heimdallarchaeota archaeon]|nr:tetratricopeptide repeat protein [Candidatus Heimdallarchaeota archaeon]